MNPILKILEKTDGSVTAIIEALTGEKAEIRNVTQKIVRADEELAELLHIDLGDEVNYRVVDIISAGKLYARAVSYAPLKRLDKEFRDDLLMAEMPIGKIIRKHKLEIRREINWSRIEENDMGKCLVRNYSIIHRGEVLINITEYFPFKSFEWRDCDESEG